MKQQRDLPVLVSDRRQAVLSASSAIPPPPDLKGLGAATTTRWHFRSDPFAELATADRPKPPSGDHHEPTSEEVQRAIRALWTIRYDGSDRDQWVKIGMAARAGGVPFDGFDQWFRMQPGYDATKIQTEWRSWRAPEALRQSDITARTLFRLERDTAQTGAHGTGPGRDLASAELPPDFFSTRAGSPGGAI